MADSLADLAGNTNITRLTPGGFARSLLEAVNRRVADVYNTFDINMARAFVSAANDQYLDLIGALLGVTRGVNESASVSLDEKTIKFYVLSGTFGDINSGQNIPVPQGTLISSLPNNGGTLYRTTEDVTFLSSQNSGWVPAEAVIPGAQSNVGSGTLSFHTFQGYSDYLNNTLLVTNISPVANGQNFEGDANYRYRIVNRVLEAEAANLTAIRLAVLSTAGVADAIIIPRYRGIGTTGVILKSTSPSVSTTLLDSVTANVESVKALSDIIFIKGPREIGMALKATIIYTQVLDEDTLLGIEGNLKSTIIGYINNLDIGQTFILNRMVAQLFSIDSRISNIGVAGKPIDELYIYVPSSTQDSKIRQNLLGDYQTSQDERVIIEPSINVPIVLARSFARR